jgi:purine-binding chemotaxis protein CheW
MTELYVVFSVAGTEYGVPASYVSQLETYQGKTQVPGTAKHVTGIVQVRGRVVPLLDLRELFGHPALEPTVDTRIVVVESGARRVGLLVDKGREVLRIDPTQIQATPELVEEHSRGFFGGLVQLGPRLIMLLDLQEVLGEETAHERSAKRLEAGHGDRAALPQPADVGAAAPGLARER